MDHPDRQELATLLRQWDSANLPGGHSFPAAKLSRLIKLEQLAATDAQPMPAKVAGPGMHQLLVDEIRQREAVGMTRYGQALRAHNGRDVLRDLLDELLDAAAYIRQLMHERDGK